MYVDYENWFTESATSPLSFLKEKIIILEQCRDKLTPIIDYVVSSLVNIRQNGITSPSCCLSYQQYEDIITASRVFSEIQELEGFYHPYKLVNTNVIVNTASVNKKIIVDEETMNELLELYDNMGVVIKRMKAQESENIPYAQHYTPDHAERTFLRNEYTPSEPSIEEDEFGLHNVEFMFQQETKTTQEAAPRVPEKPPCDHPQICIKIQCLSDYSETDEIKQINQNPSKSGPPMKVKVNTNNSESCICTDATGETTDRLTIIIKKCPECRGSAPSSRSKLKDPEGESHESVTLHGTYINKDIVNYSPEEDEEYPRDVGHNFIEEDNEAGPRDNFIEGDNEVTPRESGDKSMEEDEADSKKPKMNVTIDKDNIDQSTVKVVDESDDPLPKSSQNIRINPKDKESVIALPLTRRRICSSMEFDVTKAETQLRKKGIEHGNGQIVLDLKEMGVDKLLRASRPAKCCRKAILNEKQRIALPYCVSLRSLPLVANDVEVIKQSYDMSLRRIKNTLNFTQINRDKLTYYVNLDKQYFQSSINFPWVVTLYELKINPRLPRRRNVDFEKYIYLPKVDSVSNLLRKLENLQSKEKAKNQKKLCSFKPERCQCSYKEEYSEIKYKIANIKCGRRDFYKEFVHPPSDISRLYKKILLKPKSEVRRSQEFFAMGDCPDLPLPKTLPIKTKPQTMDKKLNAKSARAIPVNRKKSSKKLKYYVGTLNGDLVWSHTLPLKPMNYDIYYNFPNEKWKNKRDSVEEKITVSRVTKEEAARGVPSNRSPRNSSSTMSDLRFFADGQQNSMRSRVSFQENVNPPEDFAPFLQLGPESATAAWAPFIVSATSLPSHVETQTEAEVEIETEAAPEKQAEAKVVETTPKKPKRKRSTCETNPICIRNECAMLQKAEVPSTPSKKVERRKSSCESKSFCIKNKCAKIRCSTDKVAAAERTSGPINITHRIQSCESNPICIQNKCGRIIRIEQFPAHQTKSHETSRRIKIGVDSSDRHPVCDRTKCLDSFQNEQIAVVENAPARVHQTPKLKDINRRRSSCETNSICRKDYGVVENKQQTAKVPIVHSQQKKEKNLYRSTSSLDNNGKYKNKSEEKVIPREDAVVVESAPRKVYAAPQGPHKINRGRSSCETNPICRKHHCVVEDDRHQSARVPNVHSQQKKEKNLYKSTSSLDSSAKYKNQSEQEVIPREDAMVVESAPRRVYATPQKNKDHGVVQNKQQTSKVPIAHSHQNKKKNLSKSTSSLDNSGKYKNKSEEKVIPREDAMVAESAPRKVYATSADPQKSSRGRSSCETNPICRKHHCVVEIKDQPAKVHTRSEQEVVAREDATVVESAPRKVYAAPQKKPQKVDRPRSSCETNSISVVENKQQTTKVPIAHSHQKKEKKLYKSTSSLDNSGKYKNKGEQELIPKEDAMVVESAPRKVYATPQKERRKSDCQTKPICIQNKCPREIKSPVDETPTPVEKAPIPVERAPPTKVKTDNKRTNQEKEYVIAEKAATPVYAEPTKMRREKKRTNKEYEEEPVKKKNESTVASMPVKETQSGAKKTTACNKDVCELYRNEYLCEGEIRLTPHESIEIVIGTEGVCFPGCPGQDKKEKK